MNIRKANEFLSEAVDNLSSNIFLNEMKLMTPAKMSQISKWIDTAIKKTGIQKKQMMDLVKKVAVSHKLPNMVAFKVLFPRARKFKFVDLDFQHSPEDLKKWDITAKQEKTYFELAGRLAQIENLVFGMRPKELKKIFV